MKVLISLLFIISFSTTYAQIYCIIVDQSNGWQEYLGKFDIGTGTMTQLSSSPIASSVNNGTNPVIDPINRKYIYLSNNPGPLKIIDLDSGSVVDSFNYTNNIGFFPRHFAYTFSNDEITNINYIDDNLSLKVYPSPAYNNLTLEVPIIYVGGDITILDISGKKMMTQKIISDNTKINISNFPSGIYYIEYNLNQNSRQVLKIIKN
ncbi:MAG: T9SS type A sorting domain-containing protein [Aureispira sp.]|nr:T9SS type A sorting domain-containing protein [Aureispira sp.]